MPTAADIPRPEYRYSPLKNSRSIRLIQFLSGPTLQCRMGMYELEDAPPYVALSYTWGSSILEKSLVVDGCTLRVTNNLYEAVDQLAYSVWERALLFWADSVCVNQQDLKERSEQVRLMNTTYSRAHTVLIWLGPITANIAIALNQITEWLKFFRFQKPSRRNTWDVSDPRYSHEPGSDNHRAFEGLRELCSRRWWSRAWIVQESVANLQSTTVCCGDRRVQWDDLQWALAIMRFTQLHRREGAARQFFGENHNTLDRLRRSKARGVLISLVEVLRIIQDFDCEDPRDKVYACLGVAVPSIEVEIIPDYTKPCSNIYQDVVATSLSQSTFHSLDFLGYIKLPNKDSPSHLSEAHSLPSWVPDWTVRSVVEPFLKYSGQPATDSSPGNDRLYNASGITMAQAYISDKRLYLRGSAFDIIDQVMTPVTSSHVFDLTVEESWTPISPNQEYTSGGTLLEAFQHTLTADISMERADERIILRGGFVDWTEVSSGFPELNLSDYADLFKQYRKIKAATCGRRLIETSQGYIGLGPANCEVGDQVCVLYGGPVLYILREHGNNEYQFVGECYLHGMMDGEALQHKDFFEREIVLV